MKVIHLNEIEAVSGGTLQCSAEPASSTWYNIGHAVGTAYAAAIDATADFFVWVDESIGG